jgi:[protein-PII] uridylyltransferase
MSAAPAGQQGAELPTPPASRAPAARGDWPLIGELTALFATAPPPGPACRELLGRCQAELLQRFRDGDPVEVLVQARAQFIDRLLAQLWQARLQPSLAARLALVAVGGYGRGELHPGSDVDVMVLAPDTLAEGERGQVAQLIAFLWDLGLEVGNSVRTLAECVAESGADVGVMTTLLEARWLAGSQALLPAMHAALAPDRVWPLRDYFAAKLREQQQRHLRANDTASNLEPNVKTGPGGLRDIQTIAWIARRQFGCQTLEELAARGLLLPTELRRLQQAQSFLWKVRFGLHALTGRREDRLLFDHQIRLAQDFGYEDGSYTLAVEQLMQRYYRTVMDVQLLNELLLQLFRETLFADDSPPRALTPQFQVRDGSLEATSDELFSRQPAALLELFLLLQQHPRLRGVRAGTLRAVSRSLWLIDEEFRQNPRHHRLFLEILRAPRGVTHELRRMNNYGVLGRYIPAFGRVVGRMQYDLFHAYTVDAHTLFVVSNARRLAISDFDRELPLVSPVMQGLAKQEIVYLAALFHDLAKGRGGDHSELGAVDAEAFCLEHGLSRYDARLVAWLVRNHLLLSLTAQKRDIGDPQVVNEFARQVGDETHLDHLYVLTCADVRGTNPKLWNSWKASLFHDLYLRARRALRRGLETPIDREELVRENQQGALLLLQVAALAPADVEAVWARLPESYFLRYRPDEIAWHTRVLARPGAAGESSHVAVEAQPDSGTTAILMHAPHRPHSFARATAALDQLGLNIVDARITPVGDGCSLDTYHVLEEDGTIITDAERLAEIEYALWSTLRRPAAAPLAVSRRAPRQLRVFRTPTQIAISVDERNARSVLELVAGDRPGLLCDVGKVLWEERVDLAAAKIGTMGERAEDVFYVTDAARRPLSPEAAERLRARLAAVLNPAGG